jgi:putative heme-binding domain-containing protein
MVVVPARAQDTAADAQAADPGHGETLYMAHCARCHGAKGGGGEGPPLARERLPRAPDDSALLGIVAYGIPGTAMDAYWWLPSADQRDIAAFVRSLAPSVPRTELPLGNPDSGRELFARGGCAGCHTVAGAGAALGPDLTAVGLRRNASYLREALTDPAAALPRGQSGLPPMFIDYLLVRVIDEDRREVTGVRVNEDSFTIQLKDAGGRLHSFYKPELRDLQKYFDRSLMPSYADVFGDAELDDLVSYLLSLTGDAER